MTSICSLEVKIARQFDYLPDVEVFLVVIDQGSFSAAAVALSTTPSVLSRAITRLENRLGCQLVRRTTRRLRLTDAGREYLERSRMAFSLLDGAQRDIQGREGTLAGRVRLSVPTTYGHYRLPQLLQPFFEAHPDVQIELNIVNRNVDLNAEGFDMAIRLGSLPDSGLVGRKLEDAPLCLVASPAYLNRKGAPPTVEALNEHQCLTFMMPSTGRITPWLLREGVEDIDWQPQSRIQVTDDVLGVVSLAEQGLGICQTFDFIVRTKLERGSLVEVLPESRGRSRMFSLLYAPHLRRSAAARALSDSLVTAAEARAVRTN